MAEKPIVNPSPKSVVLGTKKWVEAHRQMVQQPVLTDSLNHSLLEYQRVLCNRTKTGNEAAESHYKMQGALEFINLFLNLAEPVEITKKTAPAPQLDHKS